MNKSTVTEIYNQINAMNYLRNSLKNIPEDKYEIRKIIKISIKNHDRYLQYLLNGCSYIHYPHSIVRLNKNYKYQKIFE